eukprot:3175720-Rhodomonas_salina.2
MRLWVHQLVGVIGKLSMLILHVRWHQVKAAVCLHLVKAAVCFHLVKAAVCQVMNLMEFPPKFLGLVWPVERAVVGRRVCKPRLCKLAGSCLVKKRAAELSDDQVMQDFRGESDLKHFKVALKWQGW